MREIRQSGSEGGAAASRPYPYHSLEGKALGTRISERLALKARDQEPGLRTIRLSFQPAELINV
jgi:hypothetical protein